MSRFFSLLTLFLLSIYLQNPLWAQNRGSFNEETGFLQSNEFRFFTYTPSFRKIARVNQLYDDVFHVFSNADSVRYYYLPNQLSDYELNYSSNGTSWYLSYRTLYSYTGSDQILLITGQNFLGQWENAKKDSFGYGTNNLQSDKTSFLYNPGIQQWIYTGRALYTYSNADLLTEEIQQVYDQNTWKNQYRYSSGYATDSTLSVYLTERWDMSFNTWLPQRRTDYTYDSGKHLLNAFIYRWDTVDSYWYHLQKWSVSYDSVYHPVTYLYENYDTLLSSYYNGSLLNYTYDSNGNLVYSIFQNWIVQENEWENENQFFYYYEPVTGIDELELKGSVTVYPNPSAKKIFVSLNGTLNLKFPITFFIYDVSGRCVFKKENISLPFEKDVSGMQEGQYQLVIRDCDEQYISGKFQVMKSEW
ncbi:MAG: T9SS type A sorting domain-containing protein [Bacteroidetes bacterium]|nr:T9SS type A sorting domain-containing protein [Bacteroidota bacterium]